MRTCSLFYSCVSKAVAGAGGQGVTTHTMTMVMDMGSGVGHWNARRYARQSSEVLPVAFIFIVHAG